MNKQDIVGVLVYGGGCYRRGAPDQEAAEMDGAICAESKCDKCGHEGMEYHPFHKEDSYRPFSVCPKCGDTWEF